MYILPESDMRSTVRKWGNSLAVRIPRSFAEEVGIADDSAVELELEEGKIVLSPVRRSGPTLTELLSRVSKENLHGEVSTGPAAGSESW